MTAPGPLDAPVLAAVDIGTNSVHMVVARVSANGRVEILEREKEMVRLGRSGGDMKELSADAIDRGVAALRRCKSVADAHGAELAAVATSAVREAENRRDFLDRAYDEAGVSVEVISGFEEARLIHLGVLQSLPLYDERVLLCDIGGGSTEVLLGREGSVLESRSFRLGAIRLTERYLSKDTVKPKHIARCRQHAQAMFAPFALEVGRTGFDTVVGASGTIETVVAMVLADRGEGGGARTHNGERIRAEEITAAVERLVETPDIAERAKLPGVDAKRADILLGGAIILEQFVQTFGVDEIVFSDYALREGVLLDQARRRAGATLHHLRDLRRQSVEHLMELTDEHPDHSHEIARISLRLFDEMTPLLGLDADGPQGVGEARELLEAGALLCNVGVFISHSGHHKHSYYVVRNSEHLAGFTDREVELIAQLTRYHRKSAPKTKHVEWAALRRADRELVRRLAAVLRFAIGLDRSHTAPIEDVAVDTDGDAVRVTLTPRDGASVELEAHSAELRRGLLEDVIGRPVEVDIA
ncbi:Ppx/GppA phosphatase family protein [Actinospongicola halichondriae]|uniref:Ppx/GppA phosphatase family protein n=1 Tax=Actinospongicola halichondriae TaxID=3236844 RepID=UPI003D400374